MKRYLALGVVAVAMLAFPGVASAQSPHFLTNNPQQPLTCTISGNGTQEASLSCSGTVVGEGNLPANESLWVVAVVNAGCSTQSAPDNGNPDIPGQRRFSSGPLQPTTNGNYPFDLDGTVSCHGTQNAFINQTVRLELYTCTNRTGPKFDKKTGVLTNPDECTLEDSVTVTATIIS